MFLPLKAMINAIFQIISFHVMHLFFPCCGHINKYFYKTTEEFTGVIKTLYTSIQLQQWTNCLTVTKTSEPVQWGWQSLGKRLDVLLGGWTGQ